MNKKHFPLTQKQLEKLVTRYPAPFHLYDEAGIVAAAQGFMKAFSKTPGGFRNFFAVKALPNPHIIALLASLGMGADCSSAAELEIARRCGLKGSDIMFSSNDTPDSEYLMAKELGAIINVDDISHIPLLEKLGCLRGTICLRYNPGNEKGGNSIIGIPGDAKYGFTREQIIEGYRMLAPAGVQEFGLHTMVASNELDPDYFIETAAILFSLAVEIVEKTGVTVSFINLGGGMGIPYHPDQTAIDISYVSNGIQKLYGSILEPAGLTPRLYTECGRIITGPHGWLVSRVLHVKETYKTFIGLDSCMADLMRPAIYGAYHHISIPGKEHVPADTIADVTGSLCENNDKFAIDRPLPTLERGDFVLIHDTGAHGHSMGFNYNGKLRSPELLLKVDGSISMIRRRETIEDYLATVS